MTMSYFLLISSFFLLVIFVSSYKIIIPSKTSSPRIHHYARIHGRNVQKDLLQFHTKSTQLWLNRIFVDEEEVRIGSDGISLATFPATDYRAQHIVKILKLNEGDTLKAGIVNRGINNNCTLLHKDKVGQCIISLGNGVKDIKPTSKSNVDLILAVPRPLRLERLLTVISCMGVNKLFLTGAIKVEADYFGSHLFRRPADMRRCLVEGMSQAAVDCYEPELHIRKKLNSLFSPSSEELSKFFPDDTHVKFICHPYPIEGIPLKRMSEYANDDSLRNKSRIVVAIGPEGGWEEEEVRSFVNRGFRQIALGPRILRTDMAVPVVLGLAHEFADLYLSQNPQRDHQHVI